MSPKTQRVTSIRHLWGGSTGLHSPKRVGGAVAISHGPGDDGRAADGDRVDRHAAGAHATLSSPHNSPHGFKHYSLPRRLSRVVHSSDVSPPIRVTRPAAQM